MEFDMEDSSQYMSIVIPNGLKVDKTSTKGLCKHIEESMLLWHY